MENVRWPGAAAQSCPDNLTDFLRIETAPIGIAKNRSILFKEIGTGLLIGTTLCCIFLPVLGLRWGDWNVAIAVSSALFVACSLGSVIALTLPLMLERLGVDPAFGAGPIATVIQDLLSILVYFLVATSLVG